VYRESSTTSTSATDHTPGPRDLSRDERLRLLRAGHDRYLARQEALDELASEWDPKGVEEVLCG
jgi:hypothetical protein